MPLISVIVPAYNAAAFLEQCLDSLSIQSLDDFEVLVVDDGSEDSTPSVVASYELIDDRFRLIRQQNRGVSGARNTGLDQAKGRFVTFVDADDALHPEALQAMYTALCDYDSRVCITSFVKFKGDWRSNGVRMPRSPGKPEIYSYTEAMKAALYQKRILSSPWGVMMERRLLGSDYRFREDTRYEDLDAFYRFYENAGKIVYLPFPYYLYRENPDGFIHRWSDARLDVLDVTDRLLAYIEKHYPDLKGAASDRRFSAHYNMLLLMMKYGMGAPEDQARCLRVIKEGRMRALFDPNVRFKNKMGAVASFGGRTFLKFISKLYSGQ